MNKIEAQLSTLEGPDFASAMLHDSHESGTDRDFGSKLLIPVQMLLEAMNVSLPTHTHTRELSLQEAMVWQGGTHPGTEKSPSFRMGGAESEVRAASMAKAASSRLIYVILHNVCVILYNTFTGGANRNDATNHGC